MYTSRVGNRWKGFAGLFDIQEKGFSNKGCLNVLRGKRERGEPSIESNDRKAIIPQREKRAWRVKEKTSNAAKVSTQQNNRTAGDPKWETGAGTQRNKKTAGYLEQETGADIRDGKKPGIRVGIGVGTRASTGASIKPNNKREENWRQKDEGDPTGAWRFASHSFFLAVRSFFFFTTFSSESVITWPGLTTTAGSAVNSKYIISMKDEDFSLRCLVM